MGLNVRDGISVSGNLSSFRKLVDYPHTPRYRPQKSNHNHCADADPLYKKPFCYTTDPQVRWEYCDCKTSCVPPETTPPPQDSTTIDAPTNSPPVLSVQCGNQAVAFTRDKRVPPYSVFTAEGKCTKASCEVCEAERLQRGRRGLNTHHSIVGGVNVKRGNIPWQVNLGGQSVMCGGTLVAMDVSYLVFLKVV